MDTAKGVLILATIILAASTFFLFVQGSARENALEQARTTNALTLELIRAQGGRCPATRTDFSGMTECLKPLLVTQDFKEDSFAQPNDRTGETGYVVIKNVNRKTYESGQFTFFYNRALEQQGCTITGDIGYGITCRFNFESRCVDGDVLEVEYNSTKVFTKTC